MAVIIVGEPADEVLRARMVALAEAHRRRELCFGTSPEVGDGPVVGDDYVPTSRALDAALAGPSWGEKVDAKHRKAIRRIPGAIIRFPLEDGGTVDTFITDWSPLPGACAIAVHPGHPLATGRAPADGPGHPPRESFTGHYARHPLTGDLIGVWTAGWVRPDFGTGAVIVNPAHSEVDLDFARSTGLPIRFALADQPPTADPHTWPHPPVVKRGVTRQGQPFDQAAQTYLDELTAHGHAERKTLPHLTKRHPNPELLKTLVADPNATVITTNDAITKDLLWARVALKELNREATPKIITDIPVHNPQQVESAIRNATKLHHTEPDHELLHALQTGDFAEAFKALRSTTDRTSADTAIEILFGSKSLVP